ncbi:hypothetical protein DFJ73DRAFT_854953 [Zopfochytrium polystomum]|nr:hypothetical protein DFJ73DRAFT_854953 [Zopfochytrium polystomum]
MQCPPRTRFLLIFCFLFVFCSVLNFSLVLRGCLSPHTRKRPWWLSFVLTLSFFCVWLSSPTHKYNLISK